VAVTGAATEVRRQLVQLTDLDPEWELRFEGNVAGDVSGGFSSLTATIDEGLGVMFVALSCSMDGGNSDNAYFNIRQDGSTFMNAGVAANPVLTDNRPAIFLPPRVLFYRHPVVATVTTDNVDGDDLNFWVLAYAWEIQIARNLPQKFFWPATLS